MNHEVESWPGEINALKKRLEEVTKENEVNEKLFKKYQLMCLRLQYELSLPVEEREKV